MLQKAIEKLNKEIASGNDYVKQMGKCIISYLRICPNEAEKILQDSKTIAGSWKDVEAAARKKGTGHQMLSPEEGAKAILKYFGIAADMRAVRSVISGSVSTETPEPVPKADTPKRFDVSLEDLL